MRHPLCPIAESDGDSGPKQHPENNEAINPVEHLCGKIDAFVPGTSMVIAIFCPDVATAEGAPV